MNYNKILLNLLGILIILYFETASQTQAVTDHHFKVIVLGSGGGPDESNLSSYFISTSDSNNYVALDAGTILHGIDIAIQKKSFNDVRIPEKSGLKPKYYLLQNNIKAYLLTHAHMDHIAGLITASPYDKSKNIYGLPSTVEYISNNIFNWKIWPNFGNEGKDPILNRYKFVNLIPGKEYSIEETTLKVTAFPLSHSNNYLSTAFLIRSETKYVLYIGDTGADQIEKSDKMEKLWSHVAPIIKDRNLTAIFIECSFTNKRPDNILYGHLTPRWLLQELNNLSTKVGNRNLTKEISGLPVVITHIKSDPKSSVNAKKIIYSELTENNNLGVRFIIPEQGDKLMF